MACRLLDLADAVAGSTQQQPVSDVVHYIIVRRLPRGLSEAYVGHAAANSVVTAPMPPDTRIVVLEVPDEPSLHGVARSLEAQEQGYALVTENEGPYAGQAMAIGVAPTTDRQAVRRAVSALPLVR